MRVIASLLSTLFFMTSCSFITVSPNGNPNTAQDIVIDYINKTEKIDTLSKDDIDQYENKFDFSKKDKNAYKFWYLVTGITQPTGGYYYKAYIKQKKVLLCLQSPDLYLPVTTAFQTPLLLVGVNSDARLIFDVACTGKATKGGTKKKRY